MPLKFNLIINMKQKTVLISGLGGLALLFFIFSVPSFFAASLNPDQAREWILSYLKKELASQHLQELQSSRLSIPTYETAERWKSEIDEINQIKFESIKIKQFIFVPTIITSSRIFIVKVEYMDAHHHRETRYYSLSAKNNLADFFWVREQSRLMWFLSL